MTALSLIEFLKCSLAYSHEAYSHEAYSHEAYSHEAIVINGSKEKVSSMKSAYIMHALTYNS